MSRVLSFLVAGFLIFIGAFTCASAQVVISEIHYHPVEQPVFNADGSPVLDLTEDVHEFVELQNAGDSPVDLGGWTLSGGIRYTFPAGTMLAAGGYQTVAKTPARIAAIYGLAGSSILGPYSGKLGNHGDTVRVTDAAGNTVDSVAYSNAFPWPGCANALGAQDAFTGLNSMDYQYKGRSLQRVSVTANSNDPANWLASPLTGPTPNSPQAVTRDVPAPVVVAKSAIQSVDGATIIRAGSPVTVTVSFSSTASLSNVQTQFFVDDIESYDEPRNTVPMTDLGNGKFSAVLPAQSDRSVVRWRILADRGDGVETVSPRADDTAVCAVGTSGARESWHAYFVMPARVSDNPVYDCFISTAALSQLNVNVTQRSRRVTSNFSASAPPRDPETLTVVTPTTPLWDGTQPAVFVDDNGVVHDVRFRHHGSSANRSPAQKSYKVIFPDSQPFTNAVSVNARSVFITNKDSATLEVTNILLAAGLPQGKTRWVDWYFNHDPLIVRLEQGDCSGPMLDSYHLLQQRLNPGSALETTGDLWKDQGNIYFSGNNYEGPYTCGDNAPMVANPYWTTLQRWRWTWPLENHDWKGYLPIQTLNDTMWTARGDSVDAVNVNIPATRAWLTANWDVDKALTAIAIMNWTGAWDDVCHNVYFWRRASGLWTPLPWDFDDLLNPERSTQSIYSGEYGAPYIQFGVNYFKDSLMQAFSAEYEQRLWELNNSLLDPDNLTAQGLPGGAAFAVLRQPFVNAQLASHGTYYKPARPTNSSPADGSVVVGATSLTTSAYSSPNGATQASTLWEIRTASGSYLDPVLRTASTSNLTSFPLPSNQLIHGQTYYWRATHIDASGHPSVVSAETRFSYGTTSATAGALVLNEILADNRATIQNGSSYPDYIELLNTGTTPYPLDGLSLTDNLANPTRYMFPIGVTLAAGERLLVWCDTDIASPGLHTGFGLDAAAGEAVLLLNGSTTLDSVSFGPQAPDVSIGRVSDGTGGWQANQPTPGMANIAATLGSTTTLKVNEWMASPASGDDWFEVYNPDRNPVALGNLYLSDKPATPLITQVPALSFIAGTSFTKFAADGSTAGGNHCNFKLSGSGDSLVLTAANGASNIDTITFGAQKTNVSQGRLPDGAATVTSFTNTPSPGKSNYALAAVVINEALADATAPLENAVELYNPSANAVNIGGWWLSNDPATLKKYQLPANTMVAGGGYTAIYADALVAGTVPFLPSASGGCLYLSAADGTGTCTGYRSQVEYGAALPNTSFGRIVISGGSEFWPLTAHTFGNDAAATVEDFRMGIGAVNFPPVTTPIIINEIMYHPVDYAGGIDDSDDEYIELHNPTTSPVILDGWRLLGDTGFTFATGTILRPGDYVLVVSFDPANLAALTTFQTRYSLTNSTRIYGPYSAKLSNSAQKIELARPATVNDTAVSIMVDRVAYTDNTPWPSKADGTGKSLQRVSRALIGNNAANWTAAAPTPGRVNVGQTVIIDSDGDGIPDAWEDAHGLNKFDPADAAQDADGDGMSNFAEYLAGTDPQNATSFFHVDLVKTADGFQISFPGVQGTIYTILWSADFQTWNTLVRVGPLALALTVQYTDTTTDPLRCYRIEMSAQ